MVQCSYLEIIEVLFYFINSWCNRFGCKKRENSNDEEVHRKAITKRTIILCIVKKGKYSEGHILPHYPVHCCTAIRTIT